MTQIILCPAFFDSDIVRQTRSKDGLKTGAPDIDNIRFAASLFITAVYRAFGPPYGQKRMFGGKGKPKESRFRARDFERIYPLALRPEMFEMFVTEVKDGKEVTTRKDFTADTFVEDEEALRVWYDMSFSATTDWWLPTWGKKYEEKVLSDAKRARLARLEEAGSVGASAGGGDEDVEMVDAHGNTD